jgi:hypothetical protein
VLAQQTVAYDQGERSYNDLAAKSAEVRAAVRAVDERLAQHDDRPGWFTRVMTDGKTWAMVAGVVGGFFARDAAK